MTHPTATCATCGREYPVIWGDEHDADGNPLCGECFRIGREPAPTIVIEPRLVMASDWRFNRAGVVLLRHRVWHSGVAGEWIVDTLTTRENREQVEQVRLHGTLLAAVLDFRARIREDERTVANLGDLVDSIIRTARQLTGRDEQSEQRGIGCVRVGRPKR